MKLSDRFIYPGFLVQTTVKKSKHEIVRPMFTPIHFILTCGKINNTSSSKFTKNSDMNIIKVDCLFFIGPRGYVPVNLKRNPGLASILIASSLKTVL